MIRKLLLILLAAMTAFYPFAAYGDPGFQTPSGIPGSEMALRIDEYMEKHIGKTSPGAAVAIVKDGALLFSRGYGYADLARQIPVDPAKTVFEYASVSKLFVYTSLMRLAEEGKLNLHEDIRLYLPEGFLKKLRYDEPITFIDIMNHQTGFEDYYFDLILRSPDEITNFEEALLAFQPEQVYRPGQVSAYSNYGVALAAYIVEGITGEDFHSYLMNKIFVPLGMNSTSAHPLLEDRSWLAQHKALGYLTGSSDFDGALGGNFKEGSWSYISLYPAGSANGTAEDLARFAMALMPAAEQPSPLFQKRQTLEEMLSQSYAMGPKMPGFAHGFMERQGPGGGLGHGGHSAGFSAQINLVPEKRFAVVVLCNAANEAKITEGLSQLLLDPPLTGIDRAEAGLSDRKELEGVYIGARRAHNGFLKVYGYLALLHVKAAEPGLIEMSIGGQSAVFMETAPCVFAKQTAQGPIFQYNFDQVYFEMADGKVKRISGDFLPLPRFHTLPWLRADAAGACLSAAFFLLAPLFWLIAVLRQKKKAAQALPAIRWSRGQLFLFNMCGTGLVLNNGLLLTQMLLNNHRSFAEVRIQVLLNYPLAVLGIILGFSLLLHRQYSYRLSGKEQRLFLAAAVLFAVCIYLLVKWQFFYVLS